MAMFQVGDKVRRKVDYLHINDWEFGRSTLTVKSCDPTNISFREDHRMFKPDYFEIATKDTITEDEKIDIKKLQALLYAYKNRGYITIFSDLSGYIKDFETECDIVDFSSYNLQGVLEDEYKKHVLLQESKQQVLDKIATLEAELAQLKSLVGV
jgi:hypothetical protein